MFFICLLSDRMGSFSGSVLDQCAHSDVITANREDLHVKAHYKYTHQYTRQVLLQHKSLIYE